MTHFYLPRPVFSFLFYLVMTCPALLASASVNTEDYQDIILEKEFIGEWQPVKYFLKCGNSANIRSRMAKTCEAKMRPKLRIYGF